MKKKILKIAALVIAIALIIGICWFANGLVGNPISKSLATRKQASIKPILVGDVRLATVRTGEN